MNLSSLIKISLLFCLILSNDPGVLSAEGNSPTSPYEGVYPETVSTIIGEYYVDDLGDSVARFDSILFDPYSLAVFIKVFRKENPFKSAGNALDIGTGTGILGLLALKLGAEKAVATDTDPIAVKNAQFNATKLGFGSRFEARLVPGNARGAFSIIREDEKFDIIIADLPQYYDDVNDLPETGFHFYSDSSAAGNAKAAYFAADSGFALLSSLINGLRRHLLPEGKLIISLRNPPGKETFFSLVKTNRLKYRILYSATDDPDLKGNKFFFDDPLAGRKAPAKAALMGVQVFEVTT
ncbi:MAG: 50S ribosomal protein L11 methyltransferase [Candidatus Omnitrophica bacterium]|nr:50S ribosomal protein L11 methyltransferase [Candidatus Omnitrophota bacterium]